jgi:hypothetical protein
MARYYGVPLRNGLPIGLGSAISLRKPGGAAAAVSDPYFENNTMLLPGTGTNGAQNNTFLDSSANAFTITRNGNTAQGTFSPFSQTGWSNHFDGSADFLYAPSSSAFQLGTGDFTLECFIFFTGTNTTYFFSNATNSGVGDTEWAISIQAGADFTFGSYFTTYLTAPTAVVRNKWQHVVVVRSGTTLSMFVDGVRVATATNSNNFSSTFGARLGAYGTGISFYTGFISNARVVKGTAVYNPAASTITVPTSPLTAVSGTSLLTCQSNRFIDNSSNNFALTANDNTSVQAFSPFNPTTAWSAAANGGSAYFDGTGDYLTVPTNAAFAFGTGDFTVEAWAYVTTATSFGVVIGGPPGGSTWYMEYSSNRGFYFYDGATALNGNLPFFPPNPAWTHLAVSRSGTTLRMFVNGALTATYTSSTNMPQIAPGIGAYNDGSNPLNGYISGLRVVKGTAVYTAAFTPPTAPPTAVTGTSLLVNSTNAGIYDAASQNDLETVGNAQISNTTAKFGTTSIAFDGSGDYLAIPIGQPLNLGRADFTVETWVRFSSISPGVILGKSTNAGSISNGLTMYFSSFGVFRVYGPSVSGTVTYSNFNTGVWYHVAVTRVISNFTLWVDGVSVGTFSDTGTIINTDAASPFGIGTFPLYPAGFYLNGYLQDFRVTKGYARYTTTFTPPTAAFPLL